MAWMLGIGRMDVKQLEGAGTLKPAPRTDNSLSSVPCPPAGFRA